jgi:hypothetical protein
MNFMFPLFLWGGMSDKVHFYESIITVLLQFFWYKYGYNLYAYTYSRAPVT